MLQGGFEGRSHGRPRARIGLLVKAEGTTSGKALLAAGGAVAVILLALFIAGVFGDYVFTYFGPSVDEDRHTRARILLQQVADILEEYYREHGHYPASLTQIGSYFGTGVPADPFTNAEFRYSTDGRMFRVECLGSDGTYGGAGPAEDIVVESHKE